MRQAASLLSSVSLSQCVALVPGDQESPGDRVDGLRDGRVHREGNGLQWRPSFSHDALCLSDRGPGCVQLRTVYYETQSDSETCRFDVTVEVTRENIGQC